MEIVINTSSKLADEAKIFRKDLGTFLDPNLWPLFTAWVPYESNIIMNKKTFIVFTDFNIK